MFALFLAGVFLRTVTSISGAGVLLHLPFACRALLAIVWLRRKAYERHMDVYAASCQE